jgi:hypothetical protein
MKERKNRVSSHSGGISGGGGGGGDGLSARGEATRDTVRGTEIPSPPSPLPFHLSSHLPNTSYPATTSYHPPAYHLPGNYSTSYAFHAYIHLLPPLVTLLHAIYCTRQLQYPPTPFHAYSPFLPFESLSCIPSTSQLQVKSILHDFMHMHIFTGILPPFVILLRTIYLVLPVSFPHIFIFYHPFILLGTLYLASSS